LWGSIEFLVVGCPNYLIIWVRLFCDDPRNSLQ
jgi:hypothetical protein